MTILATALHHYRGLNSGQAITRNDLTNSGHLATRVCVTGAGEQPWLPGGSPGPYIVVPTTEGHLLIGPLTGIDNGAAPTQEVQRIATSHDLSFVVPRAPGVCD